MGPCCAGGSPDEYSVNISRPNSILRPQLKELQHVCDSSTENKDSGLLVGTSSCCVVVWVSRCC